MRHRPDYTVSCKPIHGFTLIELLVVIAIIALLLSIMMPALTKAKEQARTVVCRSNLRQFGFVLPLYAADNSEKMPVIHDSSIMPSRFHPDSSTWCVQFADYMGLNWDEQVEVDLTTGDIVGYGSNYSDVWRCPSDKTDKYIGYAPNYPNIVAYFPKDSNWPVFRRDPHKLSSIRNPSSKLFLTETYGHRVVVYSYATHADFNLQATIDTDGDGHLDSSGVTQYNNIGYRHGRDKKYVNGLMVDSSVTKCGQEQLVTNRGDICKRRSKSVPPGGTKMYHRVSI